jgi:sarcosine oxidase, subunit beta
MGIETTAGTLATDALVVAAGVWTPYLTRTVGIDVPIMPVVMSELETEPVPPLFNATLQAFASAHGSGPAGSWSSAPA